MSLDDMVIVFVRVNDYRIHFSGISNNKAINLLRNAGLTEKSGKFWNRISSV